MDGRWQQYLDWWSGDCDCRSASESASITNLSTSSSQFALFASLNKDCIEGVWKIARNCLLSDLSSCGYFPHIIENFFRGYLDWGDLYTVDYHWRTVQYSIYILNYQYLAATPEYKGVDYAPLVCLEPAMWGNQSIQDGKKSKCLEFLVMAWLNAVVPYMDLILKTSNKELIESQKLAVASALSLSGPLHCCSSTMVSMAAAVEWLSTCAANLTFILIPNPLR